MVVTNQDLAATHGFDPDWIVRRTGILERRMLAPEFATSDLATEAARKCIEKAGVDPADIDLIIVATFTADMPLPSTACLVQRNLGLTGPAMDMQAACAGFMYAMTTGMQFVANGCSKLALIIGAECISREVNPTDQGTYPLFGDAGGAVLLVPGDAEQGLVQYTLGADGTGADLIEQPMGGSRQPTNLTGLKNHQQFIQMAGRPVFKWAIRILRDTVIDVTAGAGLSLDDIDLLIAHQANIRIIDAATESLGLPKEKVFINLDRYGNTSAASIPLALDEALAQGRIARGDLLLLCGFGAGLTWGTALLKW